MKSFQMVREKIKPFLMAGKSKDKNSCYIVVDYVVLKILVTKI